MSCLQSQIFFIAPSEAHCDVPTQVNPRNVEPYCLTQTIALPVGTVPPASTSVTCWQLWSYLG